MLHESKVLKIIPVDLQPREDIKCRGCINGVWKFTRNRIDEKESVSCWCKVFFKDSFSFTDTPEEFKECDAFNDTVPEKD